LKKKRRKRKKKRKRRKKKRRKKNKAIFINKKQKIQAIFSVSLLSFLTHTKFL
jgi:hypothetical protein